MAYRYRMLDFPCILCKAQMAKVDGFHFRCDACGAYEYSAAIDAHTIKLLTNEYVIKNYSYIGVTTRKFEIMKRSQGLPVTDETGLEFDTLYAVKSLLSIPTAEGQKSLIEKMLLLK